MTRMAGWHLWADDTVLEDPVGVDTYTGIDSSANVVLEVGRVTSPR